MKKSLLTGLLLLLFTIAGQAQSLYSQKNLEKASSEELTLYLTKAQKLKKTGSIISLTGASTVILGIALISTNREAAGYMGLGIGVTGIGITLVGLPILATGSSRIKKVSKAFNARYNNIGQVHLVPCSIYNYQTRNIQPGIALRINF